ncbi:Acyltransferase [Nesidiocoris tenuis]|uniref:1-acylglycerol-3-phosphate O-acyltransferase n=1 Tax=Nesidiocoris tenuis TaxID=355587 RepID=A0ABN7ANA4_9HEMI|nr:Acyltransferase [Nesidiocoris tenuis]
MSTEKIPDPDKGTFREKVKFWFFTLFYVVTLLVNAIVYIPLDIVLSPFFPNFTHWYVWACFRVFQAVTGVRVTVKDAHKLKNAPKGVIVINHQTSWDFYMICSVYHFLGDVHTVSRKEVFYLWPMGYAMWRSGSLFIDTKSPQGALAHLISEASKLFSPQNPKASKIIMYPEGTRNPTMGEFLQFKRGAFKVAMESNVPVIPLVSPPQFMIKNGQFFRPAKVYFTCLDPVILDPKADLDPQIEKIKQDMLAEFRRQMDEYGVKRKSA